jgi:hypothetical protein
MSMLKVKQSSGMVQTSLLPPKKLLIQLKKIPLILLFLQSPLSQLLLTLKLKQLLMSLLKLLLKLKPL